MINANLLIKRAFGTQTPNATEGSSARQIPPMPVPPTAPSAAAAAPQPVAPVAEVVPPQSVAPAAEAAVPQPAAPAAGVVTPQSVVPAAEVVTPPPAAPAAEVAAPRAIPKDDCIQVVGSCEPTFGKTTCALAVSIAKNHTLMKPLLSELRRAASTTGREFRYDLTGHSASERERMLGIVYGMVGLLTNYYYNKNTGILQGKVSEVPACHKFVTGQYLELAVAQMTREILEEFAQRHGCECSMLQNAIITDGQAQNELDLLLTVNGVRFVVEVKSGNCRDFDKYYFVGIRYKLIPDRFLLLSAGLSEAECDQVHDFMEYYVANLANYRQRLLHMLTTNFGGNCNE